MSTGSDQAQVPAWLLLQAGSVIWLNPRASVSHKALAYVARLGAIIATLLLAWLLVMALGANQPKDKDDELERFLKHLRRMALISGAAVWFSNYMDDVCATAAYRPDDRTGRVSAL